MILHYHDTPIYYTVQGEGKPLLLLHGFLESSTIWEKYTSHFSKNNQVICVDLPGFGQSGTISEIHSMELMAYVVLKLLNSLNIETVTCIGHSMGGYVALALAEISPNSIKNLILLNSTTYKDNDLKKENRDRAIKFMKSQKKAIISMSISNLFTETEQEKFKAEIKQLKEEAYQFSTIGIIAAIKGMRDRKDRTKVLKQFEKQKRLICGSEDTILPYEDSKNITETTHSQLAKVKSGHMSWLTNYDDLVKILTFYL